MVLMDVDNDKPITRESVLKLIELKDEIESQLRELKGILDGNGVGMTESLVDGEGYPRNDIDVYQVRQARHKIICLQNDHKSLMGEIEKGLHFLHSQGSSGLGNAGSSDKNLVEYKPFAKIVVVDDDSPANLAGLQVDDLILVFGSISYDNFKSMQDIAAVVQHSVGRNVKVIVHRNGQERRVMLTPKEWRGKGLLGCLIIPLENVER